MSLGVLPLGDAPNDLAPKIATSRKDQECDRDNDDGTVPERDHADAEKRGRQQAPGEHAIHPHEAFLAPRASPLPSMPLPCEILHSGRLTCHSP